MNAQKERCFLKWCLAAQNETELEELFELILSAEERASLETRCLIVQGLLEGKKTQRQLSEDLKVSIAKITRGSNELKRTSEGFKKYLRTLCD